MEMTNMDVSEGPVDAPGVVDEAQEVDEQEQEQETSPERTGPPSEASSQEWDKVTDPDQGPGM